MSPVLVVPAVSSSWWPPADPTPEAAAAWWQVIGVVISLVFSAWVLWRQYRDRAEDRDRESRRVPERITGWVERPKREADTPTGLLRYWRITGTVANRSDTEIWDVHVRLLDEDGLLIPTPMLFRAVLAPGTEWRVWWTAGHRFKPYHPGGAEQDASALPVPRVLTDPTARLRLEVTFTDSTGRRWRRDTSRLHPLPNPVGMPRGSAEFNRALDRLAAREPYIALTDPYPEQEHLNDLYAALNEAARAHFGDVYRPSTPDLLTGVELTMTNVPGILTNPDSHWRIRESYTEQHTGVAVIAGAVNDLNHHLALGEHGSHGAEELTARVCSVLTALGGLTQSR